MHMLLLSSPYTHTHTYTSASTPRHRSATRLSHANGGPKLHARIFEVKRSVNSAHLGRDSHYGRHELCHVQPGPQPSGRRYVTALSRAQHALTHHQVLAMATAYIPPTPSTSSPSRARATCPAWRCSSPPLWSPLRCRRVCSAYRTQRFVDEAAADAHREMR
jgi:hypothetical protein